MGGGGAPSTGLHMFADMGGGGMTGGMGTGLGPDQNIRELWSVMESLLSESVSPNSGIQVSPGATWALDSLLADPLPLPNAKVSGSEGLWQDTPLMAALRERLPSDSIAGGLAGVSVRAPQLTSPTQMLPSLLSVPPGQELGQQGLTGQSLETLQALQRAERILQKADLQKMGVSDVIPLHSLLQQVGEGDLWDLLPSSLKQQGTPSIAQPSMSGDNPCAGSVSSKPLNMNHASTGLDWNTIPHSVPSQATDEASSSMGPSTLPPDSPAPVGQFQQSPPGAMLTLDAPSLAGVPPSLGSVSRRAAGSSLRSRRGLPDLPVTPRDKPHANPPVCLVGGPRTPSPKSCKREVEGMQTLGPVKWEPGTVNKSPRAAEAQKSPGGPRISGIPPRSPTGILAGEMARLAMGSMSPAASPMSQPNCGSSLAAGGAALVSQRSGGADGAAGCADLGSPGIVGGLPFPGALKRSRDEDGSGSGSGSCGLMTPPVASQSPGTSGCGAPGEHLEPDDMSDQEEEQEAPAGRDSENRPTGNNRTKQSTKPRSVAERMRRERISVRLQRLKDVMPKTDARIDTAAMLEDAVTYIKSLQSRCKSLERHNSALTAQVEAALAGERR